MMARLMGKFRFLGRVSVVQINEVGLHGSRGDDELFYAFQSFLCHDRVPLSETKTRTAHVISVSELDFIAAAYETYQVFVTSKDGTRVPMYLTHKKGLQRDGHKSRTLLYGYGGFNIANMPRFEIHRLIWLEMGGVYASANMRGGGEYGEDWHQGGMLDRKQNALMISLPAPNG